jgi:Uma2 family endonuclease
MSTVLENADQATAFRNHHDFNRAVWDRLVADPEVAKLDWRIETDEHGQIIMSPPPAPSHGHFQSEVAWHLRNRKPGGKVVTECPISTRKGVKAADVAWCSLEIWHSVDEQSCFTQSPEICVEILSPSNTRSEIAEKKALYFEEGAIEVWLVSADGTVQFFHHSRPETAVPESVICEAFPKEI